MKRSVPGYMSPFLIAFGVMLMAGCGKTPPRLPDAIFAELREDRGQLFLELQNISGRELMICRRNFYLPLEYIDIRHYPDTMKLPFERLFGNKPCVMKRKSVTMSDFISVPPNKEIRLPLDLRCVKNGCSYGDTVFIAVRFRNINPFACSRLKEKKYDEEIQEYCGLFRYIPDKGLNYWEGEVKTPYFEYSFCKKE